MQNSKVKLSDRLKLIKGSTTFNFNHAPEREDVQSRRYSLPNSERVFTPTQHFTKQVTSSRNSLPLAKKNIANERLRNLRTSIITSVPKNLFTESESRQKLTIDKTLKNAVMDNIQMRQKRLNNSFESPLTLPNNKRKCLSFGNEDCELEHINKVLKYNHDHTDVNSQVVAASPEMHLFSPQIRNLKRVNEESVSRAQAEISNSKFPRIEHGNFASNCGLHTSSNVKYSNVTELKTSQMENERLSTNNISTLACSQVNKSPANMLTPILSPNLVDSPNHKFGKNIANDRLKKLRNSIEATKMSNVVECINTQNVSFNKTDSLVESRLNKYNTEPNYPLKLSTETSVFNDSSSNKLETKDGIRKLLRCTEIGNEYTNVFSNDANRTVRNTNKYASPLHQNNTELKSKTILDTRDTSFDKFKSQAMKSESIKETIDNLQMVTGSQDEEDTSSPIVTNIPAGEKLNDICIVVDTNIFLGHLKVVKEIINLPISGNQKPIVYVPWMVFTELDFMKEANSNKPLSKSAQTAICYINSLLQAENSRIKGETVFEANNQIMIGKSPDDKIIASCLQVSQQYETVILLSNDVNAKNKAIVNHILSCSHNELIVKLHGLLRNRKNRKFLKIEHKMNLVCSYVICECARDAYGDVWSEMDLLKSKPWSLLDCLRIFKKYWRSVFSDKLLKQFQQAVDDLIILLERKNSVTDDSEDFKDFTNITAALCIFLKDIDSVRSMMEKTVKEILVMQKS